MLLRSCSTPNMGLGFHPFPLVINLHCKVGSRNRIIIERKSCIPKTQKQGRFKHPEKKFLEKQNKATFSNRKEKTGHEEEKNHYFF